MNEGKRTNFVHVHTGQQAASTGHTNTKIEISKPAASFTLQQSATVAQAPQLQQPPQTPATTQDPIQIPNSATLQHSLRNSRHQQNHNNKKFNFTFNRSSEMLQRYSFVITAAVLLAVVGISAPVIMNAYASHKYHFTSVGNVKLSSEVDSDTSSVGGLNKTVSAAALPATLQAIQNQTAILDLGTQKVPLLPSRVASWVTQTPIDGGSEVNLHVDANVIAASLKSAVNEFVIAPVNAVTITLPDGSTQQSIAGTNGTTLSSSVDLDSQAIDIAKNLFSNRGFTVSAPLTTLAFQNDTPANFSKLIVADVDTKITYLFQNGNLIDNFLSSDGKPADPTPIGEFHILDKLTSQTMTGPGYVQPNVPWINYFDHSGDAIHGVYWRPASVFGHENMSHGCVGLPVATAEFVYNWAPIGTTVITSHN